MKDTYRTIAAGSEGLYREKGSKFISMAYPVADEEAIKKYLDQTKKNYHDARHRCYAWRLGADMNRTRTFDDGEPHGCAGNPIYSQIRSRRLTNVLVIVVRYFGGTLLGRGGLVHAYRTAAGDALDHCRPLKVKVSRMLNVEFGYAQMNTVMHLIKELDLDFRDQKYGTSSCSIQMLVWERHMDRVKENLMKIDGCKVREV